MRAQTLSDTRQVVDALIDDARRLLRISQVEVRGHPAGRARDRRPAARTASDDRWIVAPGQHRARSTTSADQQALEAMVAVSSDAFARLRLTEDMTHLARHDLLTNLPNRGLLLDRVEHALQLRPPARHPDRAAVRRPRRLQAGQRPVRPRRRRRGADRRRPAADRLRAAAATPWPGSAATSSRCCSRTSPAARSARRLRPDPRLAGRGAPHVAGHQLAARRPAIGVAFGDGSETAESMLRNADLAMYEAKARGKNQYVAYERAIGRSRLQRLELVESLRAPWRAGDLPLVYQPVVAPPPAGSPVSRRWPAGSSNGVDVPPDVFIRVAEETGLVVRARRRGARARPPATRRSLREAAGGRRSTISVNISAKQLREPDFVAKVERAVAIDGRRRAGAGDHRARRHRQRPGVDGGDADARRARACRSRSTTSGSASPRSATCRTCRCRSSRPTLSFSESIDRDERSCALLCSITMMGQALGLDVVVEGIERASQLDHLRDHVHAPFAQGYLMHRPMPLEQLLKVIRENRRREEPPAEPEERLAPLAL